MESFLNGVWKRVHVVHDNQVFDERSGGYHVYDGGIMNFYNFRYDVPDELLYNFEHHIDFSFKNDPLNNKEYKINKKRGIIHRGDSYLDSLSYKDISWREVIEKKEEWTLRIISDKKMMIIYGEDPYSHEIFERLENDDIPEYLNKVINN